jgi:transposase-like protein
MNATNIAINPFDGSIVQRFDHTGPTPLSNRYSTEFKKMVAADYYNGKTTLDHEKLAAKWKISIASAYNWVSKYNPNSTKMFQFTINLSDLL